MCVVYGPVRAVQVRFDEIYHSIHGDSKDMVKHMIDISAGFKVPPPIPFVSIYLADPIAMMMDIAEDVHRFELTLLIIG